MGVATRSESGSLPPLAALATIHREPGARAAWLPHRRALPTIVVAMGAGQDTDASYARIQASFGPNASKYSSSAGHADREALARLVARIAPLLGIAPRMDLPTADQQILASLKESR